MKRFIKPFLAILALLWGAMATAAAPPPPTRWAGIDPLCFTKSAYMPRTSHGWVAFQLCKNLDGTWEAMGAACKHGPITPEAPEVCDQRNWPTVLGFLTAGDFSNTARAQYMTDMWVANVKYDCVEEAANAASPYKPVCDDLHGLIQVELIRLNPPPPPPVMPPPDPVPPPVVPPTLYQLVKAASNANPPHTKPMYKWDGVKRGTAITGLRAPEFAACDCTTKDPGAVGTLYCLVPSTNRTDALAECEVKP